MILKSILFVVLFSVSVTVCFAKDQTIKIGETVLKVGMPQNEVLDELGKNYRLEQLQTNSWLISSKSGPPYEVVVNVAFQNGKLNTVIKYWDAGFEQSDPVAFVATLFSLFKNLIEEGNEVALVSTGETRQPGVSSRSLFFVFGNKRVDIGLVEGVKVEGRSISAVSLSEVIE